MTMRFNRLPLVLPVLFTIHCIEELPNFIAYGDRHGIILPPSNALELALAMLGFLVVIAWVSARAVNATGPGDHRMTAWLVLFAAVMLHAALNVGASLLMREYAPGALVAGLLYLPFGIYVSWRALGEGWLTGVRLAGVFGLGLIFYVGLCAVLLATGHAIRGL
jgi:hypothetical protein